MKYIPVKDTDRRYVDEKHWNRRYGTMHSISEDKAAELIRNARELREAVQAYLK